MNIALARFQTALAGRSPAELFDYFTNLSPGGHGFSETFEPVALPGSLTSGKARAGDFLIARALDEGGIARVSVIQGGRSYGRFRIRSDNRLPRHALVVRLRQQAARRAVDAIPDMGVTEAGPRRSFKAARFRGHSRLDAVLNGRATLRRGSRGGAVRKAQQALLDLGYELPRFGADGVFGAETGDAVHGFQTDQRRFEPAMGVDRIVGSQTLTRLDLMLGTRIRMDVAVMTPREQRKLISALQALKAAGTYHGFVRDHANSMPTAHRQSAFLPWHRQFILNVETELRILDPGVALPYWDWAADPGTDAHGNPSWNTAMMSLMGGDGSGPGNEVTTGPFAGWVMIDSSGANTARRLARTFGRVSWATTLPTQAQIATALGIIPYDSAPWDDGAATTGFRNELEGWANGNSLHNVVHGWVGGSMLPPTSPNDPCFFLHHCFVDKIWAQWQTRHPLHSYLPPTPRARTGSPVPAAGIDDDVPVFRVAQATPVTFKPRNTLDTANLADHRGNSGLEVNYV